MHRARALTLVGAGLLGLALLLPCPAAADWPTDPAVNLPLCTAAFDQYGPSIVPDGAGGSIVAWYDARGGTHYDIYAQRVSADGAVLWAADGVAVCTALGDQYYPTIASDGAGGAIVTWWDFRNNTNYNVYAQRISADGAPLWLANGVAVCNAVGDQYYPQVVADGAGGAIVAWWDFRSFVGWDVYAQRLSSTGAPQWTFNGVAVCTATNNQYYAVTVPDGTGGAIVAWTDYRSGTTHDIYARRIAADGTPQWTANGVALCTADDDQSSPAIASDGEGGAILAWTDHRSGTSRDIYVQRVSADGTPRWTADGVALCTADNDQPNPVIAPDGMGGAIVAWPDYRNGTDYDVYAQRVWAGVPLWTSGGTALCTAAGDQYDLPAIVPDGAAGAIVAWADYRGGPSCDIYAQRVSASGAVRWTADGVALCTAVSDQYRPPLASDGEGGAIVAWEDMRSGESDIYAQRVLAGGALGGAAVSVPGGATTSLALEPVRPNPSRGGTLTVRFTLPGAAPASLELLDLAGRRVAARDVGSLGAGWHALDLGEGHRLAPGLYLVRLRQGTEARVMRVAVLR